MNVLAVSINGLNTGEISDRFPIHFVPVGYVFSNLAWIYVGLIAFTIYQALPSHRAKPHVARMGHLYVLSSVANIL